VSRIRDAQYPDAAQHMLHHSSTTFLDILLGTALVHYYAPKHHPRALKLLNGVLDQYPESVPCYIGRGYVFAGEQRWAEATVEFEKVIELEEKKRGPSSLAEEGKPAGSIWSPLETEAKEQQGWCLIKQGRLEEGKAILDGVSEVFDADTTRGEDSARVWWRKGIADWEMGGELRPPRRLAFCPI
jgi:superkiller protein 3